VVVKQIALPEASTSLAIWNPFSKGCPNDVVAGLSFGLPLSSGARFSLHRYFRFQSAFVFFRHGLNLHSFSKKLSSPPIG
jgi:hypothetical protein